LSYLKEDYSNLAYKNIHHNINEEISYNLLPPL